MRRGSLTHDKHWSGEWDVVLVLSAATKKGKQAIQDAFLKIPFDEAGKPTLLISTTGTTGTGVDSLQRANHAVLFELPFVEAEGQQAAGRIHRAGQQLPYQVAQILGKSGRLRKWWNIKVQIAESTDAMGRQPSRQLSVREPLSNPRSFARLEPFPAFGGRSIWLCLAQCAVGE